MGLSLIFCAGADAEAPKKILKALETVDYEALEPLIARKADFSLHLIPRDLELLSQCAAPFSARKEAPFRAGLTCYLDEADRGLFIVSEEWEQYMAAIDPAKAKALTETWFQAMGPEAVSPSPDAVAAVEDLIALCQYAGQTGNPVLHMWML
ncbi:hypothetical protein [Flintibacter muris]|uniref:hypothetical protein n=1 Tax=Flintibacter muris TaxID=2941327 RepID=UPI00203B3B1D|nr:hypothetical protein [Flintibacter muris]